MEVDVPLLQGGANLDHGIEPLTVATASGPRFLPTSPEHSLKRLVAAGYGDVWALCPSFRAGERGRLHAPEFRMLEWYRQGWDDRRLRGEVIELLGLLTGLGETHEVITWREAFRAHVGIDPETADETQLFAALGEQAAVVRTAHGGLDREAALDLMLTSRIEPALGCGHWTVLCDYPAKACAQAQVRQGREGEPVAARFEIYRNGIELANGYHECGDADELRRRFLAEKNRRERSDLVLDERYLAALGAGLPPCAGVAVGFDRVVMLALALNELSEVLTFAWDEQ